MAKDTEKAINKFDLIVRLWFALLKRPNTYYRSFPSPVSKSESKFQRLTPGMEGLRSNMTALATTLGSNRKE